MPPSCQRPLAAVAALAALLLLSGCLFSAARSVGASLGVAAYQERGVDGRMRDLGISTAVREALYQHDHEFIADLSVTVYDGRVVLTGAVEDAAERDAAERLAADVPGVAEVVNELIVAEPGALDVARDTWISTQLDARLVFDRKVDSVNYTVHTVDRTIYLIGVCRDKGERDRVIAHARDIPHVRRAVSHIECPPGEDDERLAGS